MKLGSAARATLDHTSRAKVRALRLGQDMSGYVRICDMRFRFLFTVGVSCE